MKLDVARRYAEKFVEWLTPYCERIEIAGSIRRERSICNDVDLVVIPKRESVQDLAGDTGQSRNLLHKFLSHYVDHSAVMKDPRPAWLAGKSNPQGQNFLIQTPKTQLDIFCATEETWGTLMLCRTGSKEHNIWLASRAKQRNLHWNPYRGLLGQAGLSEAAIYSALDLPWINPPDRELPFLLQSQMANRKSQISRC